jgi:hypothetical protein
MAVDVSMTPALTPVQPTYCRGLHPTAEAADEAGLLALHDHVDDASVRLRFFTLNRKAGHENVEHVVHGTGETVQSLVAVVNDGIVRARLARRAEVAFLVADEVRRHGWAACSSSTWRPAVVREASGASSRRSCPTTTRCGASSATPSSP